MASQTDSPSHSIPLRHRDVLPGTLACWLRSDSTGGLHREYGAGWRTRRERRGEDCRLIPQPVRRGSGGRGQKREWADLFLDVGALGISLGALSGMRFVGQNKAGSWPLHQTKLARPGADNMVLGDGISPSRDLLQGLASCDPAATPGDASSHWCHRIDPPK